MKKSILKILSIVLLLFTITNTYAIEVVKAGDVVTHSGDYSSTRFVAGNKVTNTADVEGIVFIAGNELILNGKAPYGFYAGNIVTVNENVEKDMFVAGNHVTISNDAVIGRDAYIAGSIVTINTNIGRDLRVGASSVDLSGATILGDAYVTADVITLNETTNITGKLLYPDNARVTGLSSAKIGSIEKFAEDAKYTYTMKDKITDFVVSSIAAFIVLVVLFYLIPNSKDKLEKFELNFGNIAKTSGIGLLFLIVVPLVSVIAMFTGILVPLSLITLAIYIISIYLSLLLVCYIVGNVINSKVFNNNNKYLSIILGIIIVKLLVLIPYIGGLLGFISLIFGLGLICKFIKPSKEDKVIKKKN